MQRQTAISAPEASHGTWKEIVLKQDPHSTSTRRVESGP